MKNFVSNIIAGVIAAALFAFLQTNSAAMLDSINTTLNPVFIASVVALVLFGACIGWLLRGLFVGCLYGFLNSEFVATICRRITEK